MAANRLLVSSLLLVLLLLGSVTAARGQSCPAVSAFPPAPAAFTHTAAVDGDWGVAATWGAAGVPGNGAIVCIPAGRKVTVKTQESPNLRFIQANGELRMWIHSSTRLRVDTLFVAPGGTFVIGDAVNTVKAGVVAELAFTSWNGSAINRTWDSEEKSRGFISKGTVRVYGEPKTHMVPMTADALKGATSITLDSAPTNWKVNDEIVITGSYFRRVTGTEPIASSQDERRTLTAVSGATLTFSPALTYDHVRARSDLRLHVANLTRNVIFRSESATSIPLHGHVMMMNGDVDVRHVSFVNLGRTNKAVPLDDMVVTLYTSPADYSIAPRSSATITNRRGRYALHFHLNGTVPGASTPPSKVYNCVVDGAVGWGFVNHGSHVDFQNDVAYNFVGGGFVTEFGNELGNFFNNIAIRGTGNGEYRTIRLVFENPARPQPLGDFAFSGDGFWFQGPAVRAKNNVASGCDGAGMMWFTSGSPDVTDRFDAGGGHFHDRYVGFPRTSVATVYAGRPDLAAFLPRYWDSSATNEKLLIPDLPILECDGFEGYGNLVGFRLRFNNHSDVAWFSDDPFDFENQIIPVGTTLGYAIRMRETVKNLKLWNNEQGFSMRYVTRADWQTVTNVNRLDYNSTSPYAGAELIQALEESTITGLTTDGYEVADYLENCVDNLRGDVVVSSQTTLNHATVDTWKGNACSLSCPVPTVVAVVNTGTTSRRIDLQAQSLHGRYVVRYRISGSQQWKYASSTTTSVTLSGLSTGKTYNYQVIAGCKEGSPAKETRPSNYTTLGTFTT